MSPAVVRPGDDVTVSVDVTNDTAAPIEAPTATLSLSRYRISSREGIDQWTAQAPGDELGTTMSHYATSTPLAPGATWHATLTLDSDSSKLLAVWGPRGLSVTVTDGTDPVASPATRLAVLRTFLIWYPVGADGESASAETVVPVHLGTVVPITGPALDLTDASAAQAAVTDATRPGSRLSDVLDATRDTSGVTWAVDPALVAFASHSPDTATSTWARGVCAAATDHDVHALPPFDSDVAAYAHAGKDLPRVAAVVTTADCTGTGDAGQNLARTWKRHLAWPAADVPDGRTLAAAADSGFGQVVVRPTGDALAPVDRAAGTPGAVGTVSTTGSTSGKTVTALTADDELSTLLSDTDPATSAASLQTALALTAVVARQSDTTGEAATLLAALPRDWNPDPTRWRADVATLAATPWLALTDVSALTKGSKDAPRLTPPAARTPSSSELAPASLQALADARGQVTRFTSIAATPDDVRAQADPPLLAPASVAFRADPAGRTHAVTTAVAAAAALSATVTVVPGSTVNLISADGDLPVTVRNEFDQDVTVRVALRSSDPKLVVRSEPEITVRAHDDGIAHVAVRGIGNGDVSAHVELLGSDGRTVYVAQPFGIRVRAGWETVGTAVVAVLLGVAFVAGIWRTVRRGRSSARTTRAESPEAEVAGTPEAPPTGSTPAAPRADAPPSDGGHHTEIEEHPSDPATPAGRVPGA